MRIETDKATAITIISLLEQHGVRDVVVSPGSRNTPLINALAVSDSLVKHVVIDERAAAFMALGMARTADSTVALVCTSGTALLNYAPAVAEAFYQGVSLLLLTADRPKQWIDQDDSQTIHQFEALGPFVKGSFDLPDINSGDREMMWYANRTINQAILLSQKEKKGPVHINMQFNNPLTRELELDIKPERKVTLIDSLSAPSRETVAELAERAKGKKILLTAGFMNPDHRFSKSVSYFNSLPNTFVLAESLANLHVKGLDTGIDRTLAFTEGEEKAMLYPDIVITTGGPLVSRFMKTWLRDAPALEHWSLDSSDMFADCFFHLTLKIEADPHLLLSALTNRLIKGNDIGGYPASAFNYKKQWQEVVSRGKRRLFEYISSLGVDGWSDFTALHYILQNVPDRYNIHFSNGTSVRYGELFAKESQHALYSNRGTSGIEGSTSTAIGSALKYKGDTLLVTGDMSFLYDLGGLSLTQAPSNFRIVVLYNGGGDIFRFIPTTKNLETREQYCSCRGLINSVAVDSVAEAFGYSLVKVMSMTELRESLPEFLNIEGKSILLIDTSGIDNAEVLSGYFKFE